MFLPLNNSRNSKRLVLIISWRASGMWMLKNTRCTLNIPLTLEDFWSQMKCRWFSPVLRQGIGKMAALKMVEAMSKILIFCSALSGSSCPFLFFCSKVVLRFLIFLIWPYRPPISWIDTIMLQNYWMKGILNSYSPSHDVICFSSSMLCAFLYHPWLKRL